MKRLFVLFVFLLAPLAGLAQAERASGLPICTGATPYLKYNTTTLSWECDAGPGGGTNHNILSSTHSDSTAASGVLGDLIYFGTAWTRRTGNTTTTRKFLRQLGDGAASAAPDWDTLLPGDLGSGYIDATGDFAAALCGTNQILEDQGASWACIATPSGGTAAWQALTNTADTATSYISNNTAETVTFSFEAAFAAATQQFLIRQQTGNPTGGTLFDVRAADPDVTVFRAGDGSNGITVSQAGALTAEGTGSITATLGDSATAFFSSGTIEDARLSTNVSLLGQSIGTTEIDANAVDDTKLRDSLAASVIGRSGSTGGDPADIQATLDGQVLRRAAGAVGFGAVDLADTDAVTGLLADGNIAAAITRDSEWPSAAAALTNKTYDADAGAGNVLTVSSKVLLLAAGCNNATAAPTFDLPTANAPTATCFGTSWRWGALDFPDGASDLTAYTHINLPSDFTGAIDVGIHWFSGSTNAQNVIWGIKTTCIADAEDYLNPTFNASSDVTDANKTTANQKNDASLASITITGCAPGEDLVIGVIRRLSQAGDTLAATAELVDIEITLRRAM